MDPELTLDFAGPFLHTRLPAADPEPAYAWECLVITVHIFRCSIVRIAKPRQPMSLMGPCSTLQVRSSVNGSLLQTLNLPKLALITAKDDIFFTTTKLVTTVQNIFINYLNKDMYRRVSTLAAEEYYLCSSNF